MSQIKFTRFNVAVIDDDTHISKWVEEEGRLDYQGSGLVLAERYLRSGDVAVDAGACIGDHTIACLRAVGENGIVYAFEPNPLAFECLKYNCPKAKNFNAGLSDKSGKMGIVIEPNAGGSWLRQSDVPSIEVMPLDSLNLDRLHWFKIDVEGMEVALLRGAEQTIRRCRPILLVELNDGTLARNGETKQSLIRLMEAMNYRMELCDPQYGLDRCQIDVLFFPK